MADPETATAEFIRWLDRTHKEVLAAIDAIEDPQEALNPAQEVFRAIEVAYEAASRLRNQLVRQLWEADEMKPAVLADRLNVSRQRVEQIVKAPRAGKDQP